MTRRKKLSIICLAVLLGILSNMVFLGRAQAVTFYRLNPTVGGGVVNGEPYYRAGMYYDYDLGGQWGGHLFFWTFGYGFVGPKEKIEKTNDLYVLIPWTTQLNYGYEFAINDQWTVSPSFAVGLPFAVKLHFGYKLAQTINLSFGFAGGGFYIPNQISYVGGDITVGAKFNF